MRKSLGTKGRGVLWHTRFMSVITIGLTLVTLGILGIVLLVKDQKMREREEQQIYRLPLPAGYSELQAQRLVQDIKGEPFVRSVEFISVDSIARQVHATLGDDPIEVLGYNPFDPMISLKLGSEYSSEDSLRRIEERLQHWLPEVQLSYQRGALGDMRSSLGKISLALEIFILLQLLITYVQISNTTKLIIYSKRLQIRTLSLVGASRGFIRKPIVTRAVVDALIGALLAIGILLGLLCLLESLMSISLLELLGWRYLALGGIALVVLSILISYIASRRAAAKYIRMDGGKLNII